MLLFDYCTLDPLSTPLLHTNYYYRGCRFDFTENRYLTQHIKLMLDFCCYVECTENRFQYQRFSTKPF